MSPEEKILVDKILLILNNSLQLTIEIPYIPIEEAINKSIKELKFKEDFEKLLDN